MVQDNNAGKGKAKEPAAPSSSSPLSLVDLLAALNISVEDVAALVAPHLTTTTTVATAPPPSQQPPPTRAEEPVAAAAIVPDNPSHICSLSHGSGQVCCYREHLPLSAPASDATTAASTASPAAGPSSASSATPSASRWYCVIRGRKVGVFEGWMTTSPLVTGVPYCQFCRFTTRDDAVRAFNNAIDEGQVYETGE